MIIGYGFWYLAEKGLKKATIETWCGNESALKLFDNLGFIRCGGVEGKTVKLMNYMPMIINTINEEEFTNAIKSGNYSAIAVDKGRSVQMDIRYGNDKTITQYILQP